MPKYGLPGVAADKRQARVVGGIIVAVIAAVVLATTVYRSSRSEDGLRIALHTEQIGDGVSDGTLVRLDGVQVGKVAKISPDERGTQRIDLQLDSARLHGLDDSLRVDYAPANLFGISEIELRRGPGGQPLQPNSVIELTGANAAQVYDATMGSLLRSISQLGSSVLTEQMAAVISQVSSDFESFTPLIQALITASRTIADNQTMPSSELLGKLGPAFDGGGKFAGAAIQVLSRIHDIQVLQGNTQHYDAGVAALTGQVLPGLTKMAAQAGVQLNGLTTMLTPVLNMLAQMVSRPQQSGAELNTLLTHLRGAMPDTPNGPVLNVEVDLRGMPGLSVPLLGQGGVR